MSKDCMGKEGGKEGSTGTRNRELLSTPL